LETTPLARALLTRRRGHGGAALYLEGEVIRGVALANAASHTFLPDFVSTSSNSEGKLGFCGPSQVVSYQFQKKRGSNLFLKYFKKTQFWGILWF
jgi:hypothetical protein